MLLAVAAAKIAGISTLLILARLVFRIVRGDFADTESPEAAVPAEGPRPDPIGRIIMRGFTLMLMIGVGSAFAISIGEVAQAL